MSKETEIVWKDAVGQIVTLGDIVAHCPSQGYANLGVIVEFRLLENEQNGSQEARLQKGSPRKQPWTKLYNIVKIFNQPA